MQVWIDVWIFLYVMKIFFFEIDILEIKENISTVFIYQIQLIMFVILINLIHYFK